MPTPFVLYFLSLRHALRVESGLRSSIPVTEYDLSCNCLSSPSTDMAFLSRNEKEAGQQRLFDLRKKERENGYAQDYTYRGGDGATVKRI
jgi:hypothetical protein